jgi:hypothetical protein
MERYIKYHYGIVVYLEMEQDNKIGKSKVLESNVETVLNENIENQIYNEKGELNEVGLRMQTVGLVHGLIGNIHYGHQKKIWDSAAQLRYIIAMLEKGFAAQLEAEAVPSMFNKKYSLGRNRKRS